MWLWLLLANLAAEPALSPNDGRLKLVERICPTVSGLRPGEGFRLHGVVLRIGKDGRVKQVAPAEPALEQAEMRTLLQWRFTLSTEDEQILVIPEHHEWLYFPDASDPKAQTELDQLSSQLDSAPNQKKLTDLARTGYKGAQVAASVALRQGRLTGPGKQEAERWFAEALSSRMPLACLEDAKARIDSKQDPEASLQCALTSWLPEAMYLWGRLLLNRTAAEDEPHRFDGLAYLALAARSGYSPAVRRWELLAAELPLEDMERVEQTAKQMRAGR